MKNVETPLSSSIFLVDIAYFLRGILKKFNMENLICKISFHYIAFNCLKNAEKRKNYDKYFEDTPVRYWWMLHTIHHSSWKLSLYQCCIVYWSHRSHWHKAPTFKGPPKYLDLIYFCNILVISVMHLHFLLRFSLKIAKFFALCAINFEKATEKIRALSCEY